MEAFNEQANQNQMKENYFIKTKKEETKKVKKETMPIKTVRNTSISPNVSDNEVKTKSKEKEKFTITQRMVWGRRRII